MDKINITFTKEEVDLICIAINEFEGRFKHLTECDEKIHKMSNIKLRLYGKEESK